MSIRRAFRRAFLVVPVACALAQSPVPQPTLPKPQTQLGWTHETLEYEVDWRLWNAGNAKLDWSPSKEVKDGWESKLHLESIGVVSRLFHVDDDYTAEMTSGVCAVSTFMTAREGSRTRDTKVTFDASARKAVYSEKDLKTNAVVHKETEIPSCAHDVIGGLFLLRTMNLDVGKSGQIPVSTGKKSAYLKVESQRREEIKLPSGVQKTIRYEVFAFDNQLYNRSGHLRVWLTDDSRRIPVQIEVRLQFVIGTITLRLNKETHS